MDDDGDDKDDSKRRTRNLSEKKRRDQFNMLVNELGSMISTNNRKMDKSTVLKSTILYLKNHNEITVRSRAHDVQEDWKPGFLSNEEFTYLVLEALEGFVLVFSCSGKIYYISESITSLLGHNASDILNKSVFDFISTEDRPNLYNLLQNPTSVADSVQNQVNENEIRFRCHFRRGTLDFRDDPEYELVEFSGHFKTYLEQAESEDISAFHQDPESRFLFVCTGRLYTPQLIRDVSLVDSNRSEFTSRHSLEWKFLFLDHRAPPIIGYLPFEVLGTSGYDYYHFDDLEKVVTCHEALMQKGELTSCYYRFLTKGQQWIWLQTRFYITYHQWNSKPEFVVCTHRVVSYADISQGTKQESVECPPVETDLQSVVDTRIVVEESPSETKAVSSVSPNFMSENEDALAKGFHSSQENYHSSPMEVKSVSILAIPEGSNAAGGASNGADVNSAWSYRSRFPEDPSSDTGSCESRSSQRKRQRELEQYKVKAPMFTQNKQPQPEESLVPQHGIGAQYLEPAPYVLPMTIPLQLPTLPVIVSSDQAQVQDQLQRKHEQLQEMIVRQQEELRQVKEQLLLARLGMLQPILNVPNQYVPEEMQQSHRLPTQIVYEAADTRPVVAGYPPQMQSHLHPAHHPHTHNMPQ